MPYVLLDDGLDGHPKTERAWQDEPVSIGLHARAMSYCGRYLTDGFVQGAFVAARLPNARLRSRAVSALENAGLWERDEARDGWQIHDYLDYNRSRAQVLAKRSTDAGRKRARDGVSV